MVEGQNGSGRAEDLLARQLAMVQHMRSLGAAAISNVAQLLGTDGRFVIVMLAGVGGAQTMFHGISKEAAIEALREAYQGASLVHLPPPVGSA